MTFSVGDEGSTIVLENINDLKVLSSPDYPDNYPSNANVTFIVLAPQDSFVKLDFLELNIHSGCDDKIVTFDGKLRFILGKDNKSKFLDSLLLHKTNAITFKT